MSTILIARHGNTFSTGQTVVRVGVNSDLPLSSSGQQQAERLGQYLKHNNIKPTIVFTSNLKRTKETATIALLTASLDIPVVSLSMFDEIDYGPDEGKTNDQVIARIGSKALQNWEDFAIPPNGWLIDKEQIINNWRNFAKQVIDQFNMQKVLVITSNGIARFAPYITEDFLSFTKRFEIKLATGAIGSLSYKDKSWKIDFWNEAPLAEEK